MFADVVKLIIRTGHRRNWIHGCACIRQAFATDHHPSLLKRNRDSNTEWSTCIVEELTYHALIIYFAWKIRVFFFLNGIFMMLPFMELDILRSNSGRYSWSVFIRLPSSSSLLRLLCPPHVFLITLENLFLLLNSTFSSWKLPKEVFDKHL